MIKAKELRIGNLVYRNDFPGDIYKLRSISDDRVHPINVLEMGKDNTIYSCDCRLDDLEPIQLTPKLLGECGFRAGKVKGVSSFGDNDEQDKNKYTYYWDLSVKQTDNVDSFSFSIVKWGKDQKYYTFSFQNLRVRINYLHQLQNLFFALTGNELEVNTLVKAP